MGAGKVILPAEIKNLLSISTILGFCTVISTEIFLEIAQDIAVSAIFENFAQEMSNLANIYPMSPEEAKVWHVEETKQFTDFLTLLARWIFEFALGGGISFEVGMIVQAVKSCIFKPWYYNRF